MGSAAALLRMIRHDTAAAAGAGALLRSDSLRCLMRLTVCAKPACIAVSAVHAGHLCARQLSVCVALLGF